MSPCHPNIDIVNFNSKFKGKKMKHPHRHLYNGLRCSNYQPSFMPKRRRKKKKIVTPVQNYNEYTCPFIQIK